MEGGEAGTDVDAGTLVGGADLIALGCCSIFAVQIGPRLVQQKGRPSSRYVVATAAWSHHIAVAVPISAAIIAFWRHRRMLSVFHHASYNIVLASYAVSEALHVQSTFCRTIFDTLADPILRRPARS